MSESNAKSLHCVFYSHPWTALLLKHIQSLDFSETVLVELSEQSILSHLMSVNAEKLGYLTQILTEYKTEEANTRFFTHKKEALQSVIHKFVEFPAPLVFAPYSVSVLNQIGAILVSLNQKNDYKQMILLVHYQEGKKFSAIYDYVDKFHILWDIADLPSFELAELTQLLVKKHQLNSKSWGGFHLCNHPKREMENKQARQDFFESVIDEYRLKI